MQAQTGLKEGRKQKPRGSAGSGIAGTRGVKTRRKCELVTGLVSSREKRIIHSLSFHAPDESLRPIKDDTRGYKSTPRLFHPCLFGRGESQFWRISTLFARRKWANSSPHGGPSCSRAALCYRQPKASGRFMTSTIDHKIIRPSA